MNVDWAEQARPLSMDDVPRHPWWRLMRWAFALLVVALAGTTAWYVYRVGTGRTAAPVYTRASAESALAALRRADGDRWAPEVTRAAEGALRAALLEYRRQEASFFLWRNFDAARDGLRRSEEQIRQALRVSAAQRDEARAEAEASIARAVEAVRQTESVSRTIALSKYEHMLLQKSRMAVHEARLLLRTEDYAAAGKRAELAGMQAGRVTDRAARVVARFTDPGQVRAWRRMIDETIEWSRRTGSPAIIVAKETHTMTVYDDGRPVRTYRVELGSNSAHDKLYAGDNATPEGQYKVTAKKGQGASKYHKALLLNYPNEEDRARFARLRRAGEIPRGVSPGGLIEIHGDGGRGKDWTNGCVAIPDREMDDLFNRVGVGTPVTIVGSDGKAGSFTSVVRSLQADAARAD
jgi:L,D-peptidoglycan transpeptidase YkuD (ErfK/YbiS/YcfS/YnhG family)